MYDLVLILHSWVRWAGLIAGLLATMAAFANRPGTSPASADRWGLLFTIALDVQLLLGLLLYFALSPNTAAIFNDFGAAMRDSTARFWAVEHVVLMLFAVVLAHAGRILARKARHPGSRRARLLTCFAVATLLIVAATPWPGMSNGRPLFRV
jgi:hypothetical protein